MKNVRAVMASEVRFLYRGAMSTEDELVGLRCILTTLEDPRTEYRIVGHDVREREIGILQREIANLEGAAQPRSRTECPKTLTAKLQSFRHR